MTPGGRPAAKFAIAAVYRRVFLAGAAVLLLFSVQSARADDQIRTTFGGVGLVEMPSARMAADNTLSVNASFFQNDQRYSLGFQFLPWLETSFRYSGISHFDSSYPVYWDRSFAVKARLWDENKWIPAVAIGINDLVGTGVYGGEYLVASKRLGPLDVSLGLGWGRLASAGGFRNPLGALSSSLYTRGAYDPSGGNFNFSDYFHGEKASLFSGATWHTPIENLSINVEYSSDAYSREAMSGALVPKSQVNVGAAYMLGRNITLGLDWLYGTTVAGTIAFAIDPSIPQYPAKITRPVPPPQIRSPQQQQQAIAALLGKSSPPTHRLIANVQNTGRFVDMLLQNESLENVEIRGRTLLLMSRQAPRQSSCEKIARLTESMTTTIDRIDIVPTATGYRPVTCAILGPALMQSASFSTRITSTHPQQAQPKGQAQQQADIDGIVRHDALQQHLVIDSLSLGHGEAIVYYTNNHYFSEAEAVGRLSRVLMADAPGDIEKFRLISVVGSVPQKEFDVLRAPLERAIAAGVVVDLTGDAVSLSAPPLQNSALAIAQRKSFPRFSWDIYPQIREEFFDPENPFGIQLLAGVDGHLEILPGASINASAETSLYDNFNKNRANNSVLPHVRSDFLKYFVQGRTGLASLDTEYRFRLTPTIFASLKAGYLESMFAGVGGEVLWRPAGQRWALGGDLYEVKQRQYDRLFGLLPYHALTGHVAVYYASPWYDLNFTVRAGQYLAGDRGLTFEVTRRFSTGVEIGAFATKTNISSAQFGEGGFDKGIIIRIPLDWIAPIESQGNLNFDLRPIQRDGGQRLSNDATLYDETRRTSDAEIFARSDKFVMP